MESTATPAGPSNRSTAHFGRRMSRGESQVADFKFNHRAYYWAIIGALLLAVSSLAGCGNVAVISTASRPLFVADCGTGSSRPVEETVVLDWSGGTTPIYPHQAFDAFDAAAYRLDGGGTLADAESLFKQEVAAQINRIFCEATGPALRVINAGGSASDEEGITEVTTVYVTQSLSPASDSQIGEGDFDVCNEQHDNVALVFGERVRRMSSVYTFDDWVLIFANIAAHEIGHTLGYGHISREEYQPSERALHVELMLDGHTMSELTREQRFVLEQTNCPDDRARQRRLDEYPTFTCRLTD